ncbi:heavy metal-responsive transcriptional regulator [Thiohalophilus sp.]|uniref:heavy metal-responsive transcriptional regulator n=1 Tax=Thiohalophilus sp. TaxID=3028392 RepID=UPI002ACE3B6E|nr:heavy metal-responsive transcriptional regulator [Thiohalophilus sp.]MDZ7804932.1 heavy metal-responsive transcriptional regulator [Thiohalophilus sp.]
MDTLSIGQLAQAAGVTVEALRFYEKRGLLAAPQRRRNGYRQYPPDSIKRVRFIQHAKQVGFTLGDIGELLALRQDRTTSCADIKARATHKIDQVERKIKELERIRDALSRMAQQCSGSGSLSDCPILEELELDEQEESG